MDMLISLLIIFLMNYLAVVVYFSRWRKKRYKARQLKYDVDLDDLLESDPKLYKRKNKENGEKINVLCDNRQRNDNRKEPSGNKQKIKL